MKRIIILLIAAVMTIAISSCKTAVKSPTSSIKPTGATTAKITSPAKTTPAATSTAATAPTDSAIRTADDYFRFEADVHKTYVYTTGSRSTIDSYVEFLKDGKVQLRESNEGYTSQTVYSYKDGAVTKVNSMIDRAYRLDFTDLAPDPAVTEIMIMEPIAVGTKWTLSDGTVREITSVNAQVVTPGGSFEALEITTSWSNHVQKQYFGDGIGLMKSVIMPNDGSSPIEFILETVTAGTPRDQTVRFYYVNGDEKMVYIDRIVSLKTNDLFGPTLANELKTPPGSGEIGRTFTAGVSVLSLEVRNEGTLAYVNLSKEFVNEMNLGGTFESLVIHSVVNTVGNYFTVSNVLLEIEGQPYVSGHYMFAKNETIAVDTTTAIPFE